MNRLSLQMGVIVDNICEGVIRCTLFGDSDHGDSSMIVVLLIINDDYDDGSFEC